MRLIRKNIWLILLVLTGYVHGQIFGSKEPDTRSVVVVGSDSTIYTNILVENADIDLDPGVNYYWYMSNKIRSNQGDYSGNLLHGMYEVFNPDKKLLVKGSFAYGVKHGVWKEWYRSGNTKSVTVWEDGLLEDKAVYYEETGNKIRECEYKDGQLHGEYKIYRNDTIFDIKNYKNGELIPRQKKDGQKGFFQNLKWPFSAAGKDTLQHDQNPGKEEN